MLQLENVNKAFSGFQLKNVSFTIPKGVIVGFIGQNGAGKTTTLKCIMQNVLPDSGKITAFGKDMKDCELENKQLISFSTGTFEYYRNARLEKIVSVYKTFYDGWSDEAFSNYVKKFGLTLTKRVKELSAGMKVKFALALALSHNAKLFIFDEPTSGLDPIARDELLDLFRDIVENDDKSILFSTHITGDLDKCADRILFIKNGEIILDRFKDELLGEHVLIKGGADELTDGLKARTVSYKSHALSFTALIKRSNLLPNENFVCEKPSLDDIMVFYNKEAEHDQAF